MITIRKFEDRDISVMQVMRFPLPSGGSISVKNLL